MWQQLLGRVISRNTLLGNAYSALRGDRDNMGHALVILSSAAHHLYASAINKDLSQTQIWCPDEVVSCSHPESHDFSLTVHQTPLKTVIIQS